jgi:putative nucleotidyltransferase with HDIG domain
LDSIKAMSEKVIEKIKREVEEIGALPTLPEIPMKIIQLIADRDSSMDDIAKIIERDPSLTANILKVANSAYYGMPQKVASLNLALTILGLNDLINIVTSISIVRMFTSKKRADGFDRIKFWRHSFGCATASRMLAKEMRFDMQGIDFVAGLLHDIGKLIIDQYFHLKLRQIWSQQEKDELSLLEAEVSVMSVDHATLGSWLAQKWELPSILIESITFHHRPLDVLTLATPSREPALTAIVHLADILAHEPDLGFTESLQSSQSFADDLAWKIILAERPDLGKKTIARFVEKYEGYREKVNQLVAVIS